MENNMFLLSTVRILISIFVGIFAIYLTYKANYKRIVKVYAISTDVVSFAILFLGIILSAGIIVSAANNPISETYKILQNSHSGFDFYLEAMKYTGLFLFIALATSWLINYISIGLFVNLTKSLTSLEDGSNKNIAIALIGAGIVVAMGIVVNSSIEYALLNMVPYPLILP